VNSHSRTRRRATPGRSGEAPHLIVAADGRTIAFDVHGDPDGIPVLYLHGVPSGRLEVHVFGLPASARRAGVKLVAIDRPGVGGTDPRPDRTLSDTAADVAAVADALAHERFALVGYSAGSPFALATAVAIPHRITMLGIVSGIAPVDRPDLASGQSAEVARMFRWARTRPALLRAALRGMKLGARWPQMIVRSAAKGAPAPDATVLARPELAPRFGAFLSDALRTGIDGVATDFTLSAGSWSSIASSVTVPVSIWHGEQDRNAPVQAARWLHEQIPKSQLHVYDNEGHASLLDSRGQDILGAFTST
jgi:pimeloyl-ACP methyl ester carboxylesterase